MLIDLLNSFWDFFVLSAPYLMLGLIVSGILHQYLPIEWVKKNIGKETTMDVVKAAAIGVPIPLCSCSVIPTSVTLRKSGASNGSTSAFLIATPESGVDSIAMTYGLMDLPMTIIRPLAAFFSAFIAGVSQNLFNDFQYKNTETVVEKDCCGSKEKNKIGLVKGIRFAFTDLIEDISLWLSFGLILGAAINYFIPENMFYDFSQTQTKLVILAIGIPFYICASATTPIAASLILKGVSPGTALLLLLVGPATNISNIMVMQKYIGKKGILINVLSIIFVALAFSYATDFAYDYFKWTTNIKLNSIHVHAKHALWEVAISVLFLVILLRAIFVEVGKKLRGDEH